MRIRILLMCLLAVFSLFSGPGSNAHARTLEWAGANWTVKSGSELGPGPNDWSDSTNAVWVDEIGALHLRVIRVSNTWQCAEIISEQSYGYGEYRFLTGTPLDQLDTNIVGGLFTYLDDDNELDIEFVRAWTGTNNISFATQPARPGNYHEFFADFTEGSYSTHRFIWETNQIFYQSYFGHSPPPPTSSLVIAEWTYTSNSIPVASDEKVHLNLWLFQGRDPTDTNHLELVVHDFIHVPSATSSNPAPPPSIFEDAFNDSAIGPEWTSFNDPEFCVETNGTLRINPYGTELEQFGVVTTGALQWSESSGCVVEAETDWIHVVQTGTTEAADTRILLAAVSEPGSVWFATNAAVLLGAYDSSSNTLTVSFNTKTGTPSSMGTQRFIGTITNARDYLGQGGLALSFQIDAESFHVFARDREGFAVPIVGTPPDGVGTHALGTTLTNLYLALGGQDAYDGNAYIYYDRVMVYTTNAITSNAPPPAASNMVQIGTGGTLRRNPLNAYYEQERLMTLYLANEIQWTGSLVSLALEIDAPPAIVMSNYTIRVRTTDITSIPRSWITDGWTVIYRADTTFSNSGWHTFCTTNLAVFHYAGTNNLLVDFSKNNKGWHDSGYARFSRSNTARTYEQYIDDSTDPLTWAGQEPLRNGYSPPIRHKYLPNIRFMFSDDADGDGLPDAWEMSHVSSLTNMNRLTDSDGDHFDDLSEFRAGTDPRDAASLLDCRYAGLSNGAVAIQWPGLTSRTYRIERAPLPGQAFTCLASNIPGTPPLNTVTDSAPPVACAIYRIAAE